MPGETKNTMECSQFEALLSEAVDGQLTAAAKERFEAHSRVCPVCGPLLADAVAGQHWLKSLAEVEPPAHLVHNILSATTGISSTRLRETTRAVGKTPLGERIREWWDSLATPTFAFVRQPRFAMSFGMIFFSFSLVIGASGVKARDAWETVSQAVAHPSSLKRTYYTAEGRVVKFFENIRLVYELESRAREIKRAITPAEPGPEKPAEERKNNNNTSGQPDDKQERNYSREENQPVLAELKNPATSYELRATSQAQLVRSSWLASPCSRRQARSSELEGRSVFMPPDVTVTTNRRFV